MDAPKEKEYYMTRRSDGKENIYKTPKEFLTSAYAYFKWCTDNPWHKKEGVKSGVKTGSIIEIPVPRPYTIEGLCVRMGISKQDFLNYENNSTFSPAIAHIREVIKQHQIEGAIIGIYNTSIISRMHGMTDKQETETAVKELIIESDDPRTKENLAFLKEEYRQLRNN